MNKVIEVKNLKKNYLLAKNKRKTFEAVKGMSFTVQKGEIFGILGPNGAGKTTTLEIIEGLQQQTSGTVEVLGYNNLTHPEEIKQRIGVQLQSSEYFDQVTLSELLDLVISLYPNNKSLGPSASLEQVGLKDKEHELVKNLSGGQKPRFTIATATAHNPEILFLDEPTTGLDPKARRDLWQLIKSINAKGTTIVLTTHFMEEAEFLCHRVAIMNKGVILKIDEPKKLIQQIPDAVRVSFFTNSPIHEKIFSTLPQVTKVYAEYPKVILELSSLSNIDGITELLAKENITFSGFTVKPASLEDVYLQLTGQEYYE